MNAGVALQFASKRLNANGTIVKAAVGQDGFALQYAAKALQKNPDMALLAVDRTPGSLGTIIMPMKCKQKVLYHPALK